MVQSTKCTKVLLSFCLVLGISACKNTKSGQIRSGQCNSGGNYSTEAKLLQASSRIDAGTLGLMLGFLNFLMPWCWLLMLGTHCSLMPAASKWRFSPTQPLSLTSLPRISLSPHFNITFVPYNQYGRDRGTAKGLALRGAMWRFNQCTVLLSITVGELKSYRVVFYWSRQY